MTFPANKSKNRSGGLAQTKTPPPTPHSAIGKLNHQNKYSSYAAAAAGERNTLLPVVPLPSSLIQEGRIIVRTQIWRHGYSAGSVFLDMKSQSITYEEFLVLVKEQYPSIVEKCF
jgi:hypothetical protein